VPLGLRILLVEDDDELRELFGAILRHHGYEVDTAADAREGLELLERNTYRLVVTDYALPDVTGSVMIREARARDLMRGASAMMITAYSALKDSIDVPVLQKPFEIDQMLEEIARLIGD
jgi:DNA-binding response OmpR family regulator